MKKKAPPKGAPKWMATFADMTTLLLTFFVLMLSFSTIDIAKFKEMLGSVAQAYGVTTKVKGEYQAVVLEDEKLAVKDSRRMSISSEMQEESSMSSGESKEGESEKQQKLDELSEKMEQSIKDNNLENNAEVISGTNGIRIRIKGGFMFASGRANIKDDVNPFLDTIVEGMSIFEYNLLVEGHSDNLPVYSIKFPSNWELSAARATSVVRYLIKQGIEPKRLFAVGYADNYPLANNDTTEGRAKNRRVEFVFTEKELRMAIENKEDES